MVEGYKNTEIGNIPKDWDIKNLREVTLMKSGESITSKSISEIDTYPCYGGNGLRGFASRYTHDGDFALIGRQGALCGNIQFVSGKFFASEHAVVVTPKEKTDIKWLSYVLFDMNLNQYSESSAQPGLSVTKVLNLKIPFPPTKFEQTAIANALNDADALITQLKKLTEKKRAIKQGTIQELLTGKRRLSEFDKKLGYRQTEIGIIPNDWNIVQLHELIDSSRKIRYGIVQPGKFDPTGRYMIRGQDYSFGWVDETDFFRVGKNIEERYQNARLIGGDIILTIVGAGTGNVAVVPDWLEGANLTQTTARIGIIPSTANSLFCKFYLQSSAGNIQVNNYIKGGAQPGLNICDVEVFKIALPPTLIEQTRIAQILSDMDAEIEGLEKKLEKYKKIKQGMMQELLTGRIRLV